MANNFSQLHRVLLIIILLSHFQLNDTAVELFFADGTTRLFSFGDRKKRDGFLRQIGDSLPPSLVRHGFADLIVKLNFKS